MVSSTSGWYWVMHVGLNAKVSSLLRMSFQQAFLVDVSGKSFDFFPRFGREQQKKVFDAARG
ncbi:MAG: hypothetical protein PUP93_25235 [Rhizonema sp. NSF051]|nr:hypothetical protein [Rhizonema sp. NSF051]